MFRKALYVFKNVSYDIIRATHIKSFECMTANILDGKALANKIQTELKKSVNEWISSGNRKPVLCSILVGDDEASKIYIQKKTEAARFVDIETIVLSLPATVSQTELLSTVEQCNKDQSIDGILVQLPLPKHISSGVVASAIHPSKDVDGFNELNFGRLCLNIETVIPCTALAVVRLLESTGIDLHGKNVVVCGRSKHVSLPIAMLLHSDQKYVIPGKEATVTICHRSTPASELKEFAKKADVIIAATGIPKLIKRDMVKPGVCVIDVGLTRQLNEAGEVVLIGDVDFEEVSQVASHITPVPGGVGPMTVAMLMENVFMLARKNKLKQM